MSDLISRQAAIDAIWTHATNILENSDYDLFFQDVYKMTHRHIAELIQNLPSAEPVKHGRWIKEDDYEYGENAWRCSKCGEPYILIEGTPKQNKYSYCPNCGADMRERREK